MKWGFFKFAVAALALCAALFAVERAQAAGFQLVDQSPSGEGDAFAGAAAVAEDASTIFANPAGLTYLNGIQAQAGINVIMPDGTFHPTNAKTDPSPIGGLPMPLTGQGNRDWGEAVAAPHIYFALPLDSITKGLWAGLGITAPFGLVTDYGSDSWIGRYYAERTQLKTIDVNPTVAYKATNWLSLGAGVDVLHGSGLFKNAVDFGSICTNAAGAATCGPFGLSPQADDGQANLTGSDTTVGWNAGVILQPLENTRIGLAYRSGYTLHLSGSATFTVPAAYQTLQATVPAFGGNFVTTSALAKVALPATASLSVAQQVTPKWTILGDVSWTQWSSFKNFTVTFANPLQPTQVTPENWHDTFRESLGATYAASDKAKLRFGVAYDPTPVPNAFRTLNIPDDSRIWLSIGYGMQLWGGLSIDAAYTHIFVIGNSPINLASNTQGTVSGTYSGSSVNIVTLGVKYAF
ncbi:MAG TPA: outer membrane protein transport protein [Alphaproteobacteria bacterium]|nr:outer membrane protein transport protein [Alphaproteobacteria bacterium]